MSNSKRLNSTRRGVAIVLLPGIIMLLCVIAAFSVDLGHVNAVRSKLETVADAASMAGAMMLREEDAYAHMVKTAATDFAKLNAPEAGNVLISADVEIGGWDFDSGTFSSAADKLNAVRVTVRRDGGGADNVHLHFSRLFSQKRANVTHSATAAFRITEDDDDNEHRGLPAIVE